MEIEKIFRKIPSFQRIILDTILFESKYPVLVTCKNDDDIYLSFCKFWEDWMDRNKNNVW